MGWDMKKVGDSRHLAESCEFDRGKLWRPYQSKHGGARQERSNKPAPSHACQKVDLAVDPIKQPDRSHATAGTGNPPGWVLYILCETGRRRFLPRRPSNYHTCPAQARQGPCLACLQCSGPRQSIGAWSPREQRRRHIEARDMFSVPWSTSPSPLHASQLSLSLPAKNAPNHGMHDTRNAHRGSCSAPPATPASQSLPGVRRPPRPERRLGVDESEAAARAHGVRKYVVKSAALVSQGEGSNGYPTPAQMNISLTRR
ncbi:hypothetical protein VUR80DRAFT_7298 [Thermomyces stellatus]